jgi:hypothetical protein
LKKKNLLLLITLLILFTLACSLFNPELVGEKEEAPTEIAAESAPVAEEAPVTHDGVCNNILYPLLPTQQMVYKSTSPEGEMQMGMTVAKVEGNFATIDMLDMSTGIVTQSTVECEEGIIKHFPSMTMGTILGDMLNGTMTMDYLSGYIAPTEETLVANNWDMAWTSEYVMNGEITMEDEGETMTVTIDNSPVKMDWKVVGTDESITVGAGTYTNAIKVSREMVVDASIDMGVMKLDSSLSINSNHWFAPYVGMVKMEFDEISISTQGMTFPVTLSETMELIEFRPAE